MSIRELLRIFFYSYFQLENVLQFIEDNSSNLEQKDYDQAYKVWSGFDIVVRLKSIDLGPENFESYKVIYTFAKNLTI